jgi:hypothetical protein
VARSAARTRAGRVQCRPYRSNRRQGLWTRLKAVGDQPDHHCGDCLCHRQEETLTNNCCGLVCLVLTRPLFLFLESFINPPFFDKW